MGRTYFGTYKRAAKCTQWFGGLHGFFVLRGLVKRRVVLCATGLGVSGLVSWMCCDLWSVWGSLWLEVSPLAVGARNNRCLVQGDLVLFGGAWFVAAS